MRRALIQLRFSADGSCALRGLDAVLPFHLIDKIVKSCRLLCTERDIYKLGVAEEFSSKVFQLVELHIPRTTGTTVLPRLEEHAPISEV